VTQPQDRPDQKFDDLDRRLIAELQTDPRIAYASLGARLGVTGMTAANRLQRLRQSGLLQVQALPNLAELGLATEILGLAQVDMAALANVTTRLVECTYVLRIDRVTGEFDVAFQAVFPSEAAMGELVREIQSVDGVRRLVIHHVMDVAKADDGWNAVFAESGVAQEAAYELAPGATIPSRLEPSVHLAACWVNALAANNIDMLHELSTPDIVFEILPPHPSAGRFDGMREVEAQAGRTKRAYNRLWYRIVSVTEHAGPLTLMIDALSPVEDRRGRVKTAFSRMAFAFAGGKVKQVMSVGQMQLPDLPADRR
jgi:Lrp/AsnC family transcriptional regulator, regulator for asnA, asnC and gidA